MKKEEVTYLVDIKMNDGKSLKQAREEIKRDINFIKHTKSKVKEMKKEMKYLEKERINQKEKFNKEFERMIKQQEKLSKPVKQGKETGKSCNTRYLQRILNYLKEEPESTRNKISKDCGISNRKVKDGLLFLVNHNLVIKKYGGHGCKVYLLI